MKSNGVPLMMIVLALIGLMKFSYDVRSVQVLGLFASGALAGVSITRLITSLRSKKES